MSLVVISKGINTIPSYSSGISSSSKPVGQMSGIRPGQPTEWPRSLDPAHGAKSSKHAKCSGHPGQVPCSICSGHPGQALATCTECSSVLVKSKTHRQHCGMNNRAPEARFWPMGHSFDTPNVEHTFTEVHLKVVQVSASPSSICWQAVPKPQSFDS